MTEKDQKIIEDAEKNSTPLFVFTAKDELSTFILNRYMAEAMTVGCKMKFATDLMRRINEFEKWQSENPNKVKLPD